MFAEHQTFTAKRIFLDGGSFHDCHFTQCDLVFTGQIPVIFERCVFNGCRWTLEGPAASTIALLRSIYARGGEMGRQTVEQIIDRIRNGPVPGGAPPENPGATPSAD